MKREHLYVDRKQPLVWLTALCMVASSVTAVTFGMPNWGWWITASVFYLLILLLSGDEMLYRTAVPVWAQCLVFAIGTGSVAAWIGSALFGLGYHLIISGKVHRFCLLVLEALAIGLAAWQANWPVSLAAAGFFILAFAIRVHHDGKFHPTWGDRIDGRRVRTAQVMEQITAFFMPDRTGANNMFSESVEITELERYVRTKRREGLTGFSITHVILAAYVRTVAKFPALNRFIAGQLIYSRGEDIAVCMTVKKELTAQAPDSLIKVHFHPGDTAADIHRKFSEKVEEAKNEMETTADATVAGFMMIPRLVLTFAIWLLKCMDYFGLIPRILLEVSPFHGSVYFTNVGSLGIKPVFHHLYDFGTVPAFCAFGRKRRAEEIKDGEIVERKYLDLTFNLDERICDGFYYASVIKYFMRLLSHPEVLDNPPEVIEKDIP